MQTPNLTTTQNNKLLIYTECIYSYSDSITNLCTFVTMYRSAGH